MSEYFFIPSQRRLFFQRTETVVTMSCCRNMLYTRRQLTRKTFVWCGIASNAVIVSRLICEKQGAAGAAILGMKLILMNQTVVFLFAYGTMTMTRVSEAIDRSTGFLWLV